MDHNKMKIISDRTYRYFALSILHFFIYTCLTSPALTDPKKVHVRLYPDSERSSDQIAISLYTGRYFREDHEYFLKKRQMSFEKRLSYFVQIPKMREFNLKEFKKHYNYGISEDDKIKNKKKAKKRFQSLAKFYEDTEGLLFLRRYVTTLKKSVFVKGTNEKKYSQIGPSVNKQKELIKQNNDKYNWNNWVNLNRSIIKALGFYNHDFRGKVANPKKYNYQLKIPPETIENENKYPVTILFNCTVTNRNVDAKRSSENEVFNLVKNVIQNYRNNDWKEWISMWSKPDRKRHKKEVNAVRDKRGKKSTKKEKMNGYDNPVDVLATFHFGSSAAALIEDHASKNFSNLRFLTFWKTDRGSFKLIDFDENKYNFKGIASFRNVYENVLSSHYFKKSLKKIALREK